MGETQRSMWTTIKDNAWIKYGHLSVSLYRIMNLKQQLDVAEIDVKNY